MLREMGFHVVKGESQVVTVLESCTLRFHALRYQSAIIHELELSNCVLYLGDLTEGAVGVEWFCREVNVVYQNNVIVTLYLRSDLGWLLVSPHDEIRRISFYLQYPVWRLSQWRGFLPYSHYYRFGLRWRDCPASG
jgi:hypothetical protein